jgi:hypothetical protein
MHYNFTKMMVTAAALSLPILCAAAPRSVDPKVVEECTRALYAPADVHSGHNAPMTATAMFDVTGDQRLDLFVTIRDANGKISKQFVCSYDMNAQVVGAHQPWPDEVYQWEWQ